MSAFLQDLASATSEIPNLFATDDIGDSQTRSNSSWRENMVGLGFMMLFGVNSNRIPSSATLRNGRGLGKAFAAPSQPGQPISAIHLKENQSLRQKTYDNPAMPDKQRLHSAWIVHTFVAHSLQYLHTKEGLLSGELLYESL